MVQHQRSSTRLLLSAMEDPEEAPLSLFTAPPCPEITYLILLYLYPSAEDLLSIAQINKHWNHYSKHSREFNKFWWNMCLNEWYEANERPTVMSRVDQKKQWKEVSKELLMMMLLKATKPVGLCCNRYRLPPAAADPAIIDL